jgi:hypothetical protein
MPRGERYRSRSGSDRWRAYGVGTTFRDCPGPLGRVLVEPDVGSLLEVDAVSVGEAEDAESA